MQERWKTIKQNRNLEISDAGRLRNKKSGVVWKLRISRNGYVVIAVYHTKLKKAKNLKIHTLVAEAFVKNPENKPEINHKDFDKQNNHYTNLEWCTNLENVRHFYRNKFKGKISNDDVLFIRQNIDSVGMVALAEKFNVNESYILGIANGTYKDYIHADFIRDKKPSLPKPIIEYDLAGNEIGRYTSASQASKIKKVLLARIKEVLTGGRKTYKGSVYKYVDETHFKFVPRRDSRRKEKVFKVSRFTTNGEFVDSFYTTNAAARAAKVNKKGVYNVLKGTQKTAGGFVFRYAS